MQSLWDFFKNWYPGTMTTVRICLCQRKEKRQLKIQVSHKDRGAWKASSSGIMVRAGRALFQRKAKGQKFQPVFLTSPKDSGHRVHLCWKPELSEAPNLSRMHQHLGTTWDWGGGGARREISRWIVRQFIDIYITRINVFPKIAFPFSALRPPAKEGGTEILLH